MLAFCNKTKLFLSTHEHRQKTPTFEVLINIYDCMLIDKFLKVTTFIPKLNLCKLAPNRQFIKNFTLRHLETHRKYPKPPMLWKILSRVIYWPLPQSFALNILRACAVEEFHFDEQRRKKSERVKTALVCWHMQKLITIEPANDGKHTLKPKQLLNLD